MKTKSSPRRIGLDPDVKIATTHPDGKNVERYKNILEERMNSSEYCESNSTAEDEYNISIYMTDAEEVVRAALYAGLRHEEDWSEEDFIGNHGEDKEYSLIINKALQESSTTNRLNGGKAP